MPWGTEGKLKKKTWIFSENFCLYLCVPFGSSDHMVEDLRAMVFPHLKVLINKILALWVFSKWRFYS